MEVKLFLELSNHFDDGLILIQKFDPKKIFAAVHFDGKAQNYFYQTVLYWITNGLRKMILSARAFKI